MQKLRKSSILLVIAICTALGYAGPARSAGSGHRSHASLQRELMQLADTARPGTLGISVVDLQGGRTWRINAEQAFPMMSVFKAPLGATVLSEVDTGMLSLSRSVIVRRNDLLGSSRIAATFRGAQEAFTVRQLLDAAVSHSDNTAADALLKIVGGPSVVTAFLRRHGIENMRVDRGEREIATEFEGVFDPQALTREETPQQKDARLRRGYAAYLKDPRDRTTPDAAARFLQKLWKGQLLSPSSTRLLLNLMYNQTIPNRLRAGIPANVRLADKCGTSYTLDGMTAAFNDIGILTWPDGRTVIVAAFLTSSRAPIDRRLALFKQIAQVVGRDLHPSL